MIEAPEYVTPTQRKLHDQYQRIHERFFPSPPVFAKPLGVVVVPVAVQAEPPPKIKLELNRDWLLVASPPKPALNIAQISGVVAAKWNVSVNDLRSERRTGDIIIPRQITCLLARILTLKSYPTIGKFMGGRDHTTAMAAVKKFNWLGEQLRKELDLSAPLETWVNRAFEIIKKTG